MHAYRVSLGAAAIVVESQWRLDRWADWWGPYGELVLDDGHGQRAADAAGAGGPGVRFLVGADVGTSDELGDDAEPLALHGGAVGIRTSGNNGVVIANIGRAALYHVGHDGVVALNYPEGADYWELDAFQIVRGVVLALAEQSGRRRLPGAALDRDGSGLLLLGADTGVTTRFLLPLLRSGAYGLVGNERLHVDETGVVCGLPVATVAGVDLLPEVPRGDPAVRVVNQSLVVWPGRLAEAFGVSMVPRVPLRAVVVCAPDGDRSAPDLSPLPAEERQAAAGGAVPVGGGSASGAAETGAAPDGLVPQWLLTELGVTPPPSPAAAPSPSSSPSPSGPSQGTAWEHLANVPWYRSTCDPTSPSMPEQVGELLA